MANECHMHIFKHKIPGRHDAKGIRMLTFKDRTFCGSPHCKNECGRKLTDELYSEYQIANLPQNWDGMLGIGYAYFCGEPIKEESHVHNRLCL